MRLVFSKEEMKQIGRRICVARNDRNMTQAELAEQCDCSTKHIGDVERGDASISWPLAVKIGRVLNTGVDYYLAESTDLYFRIQIDAELSNIMKDCSMPTKMMIRDMAKRMAEYEKEMHNGIKE